MKLLVSYAMLLLAGFLTSRAEAQGKGKDTSSLGKDIKKGVKAVGNKTAELASKGTSKIVDKTYKGKKGPHGETVYIDNKSQYYYINKKGKRIYIKVLDFWNKP